MIRQSRGTGIASGMRSKELTDRFYDFLANHPPAGFSRRLRNLLLEYLVLQETGLPVDFHSLLQEISDLFDLLDLVTDSKHPHS